MTSAGFLDGYRRAGLDFLHLITSVCEEESKTHPLQAEQSQIETKECLFPILNQDELLAQILKTVCCFIGFDFITFISLHFGM